MAQKTLVIATETDAIISKFIKDLKADSKIYLISKPLAPFYLKDKKKYLKKQGVEVIPTEQNSLKKFYLKNKIDQVFLFTRDTQSIKTLIRNIRLYFPKSKIIVFAYSIDFAHYRTINREQGFALNLLKDFRVNALASFAQADLILTRTEDERDQLLKQIADPKVPVMLYREVRAALRNNFEDVLALHKKKCKLTSIVMLCCNQLKYTKLCINSVLSHTHVPYELIIVDNGSKDGTGKYLKTIKNAKIITNSSNIGFMKATNQGMKAAKGEYVLLLNNDTIVSSGWLDRLIDCASSSRSIGMVGPVTNNITGIQQVNDPGYKDLKDLSSWSYMYQKMHSGNWFEVFWLIGFCLLIKREVIDKIGYLSTEFDPATFEDLDYCLKARYAGYKLFCAGDVFIHHFGQKSYDIMNLIKINEHGRSAFIKKWGQQAYDLLMQSCMCGNLVSPRETGL